MFSLLKLLHRQNVVSEVKSSSQPVQPLKIARLKSGVHHDEKEGALIDNTLAKQKLSPHDWLEYVESKGARVLMQALQPDWGS